MPASKREGSRGASLPGKPHDRTTAQTRSGLLAVCLEDISPGAVTIRVARRVSIAGSVPRLLAHATDVDGTPVRMTPTHSGLAARLITAAFPDTDWDRPHDLHLPTGRLAPTHLVLDGAPALKGGR